MFRRKLFWRFLAIQGVAIAASIGLLAWFARAEGPGGGSWPIALVALIATGTTTAWLASRQVRKPLVTLRESVRRFAAGEPGDPPAVRIEEFAELRDALLEAARVIGARLNGLTRRNQEQSAVLASMSEGVLAVDTFERVISLNEGGARLLSADPERSRGRGLQEVARSADFRRFVARTLASETPIEEDVILWNPKERVLEVHGTALRDERGESMGAVFVLNDVSRMRQLETMRSDFAANVSHELKTPITSIKGFVETLLDGAIAQPADADRFLRIIARQADRLDAIIDDLLSLAKIEKDSEAEGIALTEGNVSEVLESAVNDLGAAAAERNIRVSPRFPTRLPAEFSAALLRQAVTNLLDNAIKYSESGNEVQLVGESRDGEIAISVRDQGCGIASEHLERVFERFYRVDRARSRKLGGTGLGLAIVKHIVLAHGGRVTVESSPGVGSTFDILLPRPRVAAEGSNRCPSDLSVKSTA